jgi:hypothetical protein
MYIELSQPGQSIDPIPPCDNCGGEKGKKKTIVLGTGKKINLCSRCMKLLQIRLRGI